MGEACRTAHHIRKGKTMKAKHSLSWRGRLAALGAGTILASGFALPGVAADNDDFPSKTKIKHVVIIFEENRTFDHYFATYPFAANPVGEPKFIAREDTPGVNNLLAAGLLANNPNLKQPFRLDRAEAFTCSQDHNYTDEQKAVNGGLNDMYVQATAHLGVGCRTDGSTVMAYFDGNTVTAWWNYAQHYAISDNSFDTNFGPSTPGALNLISGQTGNAHMALTFALGKVATFTPVTVTGDPDPALDDCGQDKGGTVTGKGTAEMTGKNVGDLLNAKGITWGWFEGGFAPTSPAVINPDGSTNTPAVCGSSHLGHPGVPNPTALDGNPTNLDIHTAVIDYSAHHEPFMYYPSTRNPHHLRPASVAEIGHNGAANHNYDTSDFFAALQAHRLPAVSYIKPPAFQDDHPGNSDSLSAQTFLVDLINTLQMSPEWAETAVIISYDDTDGWYDHATGPVVNQTANSAGNDGNQTYNANDSYIPALPLSTSVTPAAPGNIQTSGVCGKPAGGAATAPRCGYGPRLPFLVISPWAKENFVDHTTTDQTSSLAFIEFNWDLGFIDGPTPLPAGQGSFDRVAGSILNMFDFDDRPNLRPLVLDHSTGQVVGDHDGDEHDHDRP
jgi:phospholipase C